MTNETKSPEKTINVAPPIATLREARTRAKSLVAPHAWTWLESGTGEERTLRANQAAFAEFCPIPRLMCDVSVVSTAVSFAGVDLPMPLIGAPLGGLTQYHLHGEVELMAGLAAAGTVTSLSAMARLRIEDARAASPDAPLAYQIYFQGPEAWIGSEIERAHAVGAKWLCLCVDAPVRTVRYQDRENRYDARRIGARTNPPAPSYVDGARVTWKYVEWVKQRFDGPIVIKGITTSADAVRAMDNGADILWVSNHGGRVLDTGMPALYSLSEVRNAVGANVKIVFDGGVRTGSDMLVALALGADCVAAGRPFVYGLAVDGAPGVTRVFDLYRDEFSSTMAMCGFTSVADISAEAVRTIPSSEKVLELAKRTGT